MEPTRIDLNDVASQLGLNQQAGEAYYGQRRGFPMGFKVVNPLENPVLLFHVRTRFGAATPEVLAVRYDDYVQGLRNERKLDIDFDERIVWLTVVEGGPVLLEGSLMRIVDGVLGAFEAAGLGRNAMICYFCEREPVRELVCQDDKVAVICPACLAEKLEAPENRPVEATEGAMSVTALALLAGVVGAVGWAGFWMVFTLAIESVHSDRVYIPHIVEVLVLLLAGCVTGGPIGLVIRAIRRRGTHLSMMAAIFSTASALVVGETSWVAWLIYRQVHVFSPTVAWKILPGLEMELGTFHLMIKLLAACAAVGIAIAMARPQRPRLKL